MTEYLDRYPTMHEYAEGKRINPKLTDLISRADAKKAVYLLGKRPQISDVWDCLDALPSAETVSREEYEETDGVVTIEKKNANEVGEIKHIVIRSPNYTRYFYNESMPLPSADAVDCTDFIEWLVDRVLDETIWEYNSVAYGEIICRKLEKLGVLEVTEEPSYYIRPSADAEQGWISCSERLPSESGDYLCTIPLDADETYTEVLTFHKGRFYEDDAEWGATFHDDVLAWMPLPKPYKGGDTE